MQRIMLKGSRERMLGWVEVALPLLKRGNSTLLNFGSSYTRELIPIPNGLFTDLLSEVNFYLLSEGLHPFISMGYP